MLLLLGVLVVASSVVAEGVKLGDLTTYHHKVSGEVHAVDQNTIRIKNFNYDGAGPDAFFWVGIEGTPSNQDEAGSKTAILAYPYQGKNYVYLDQSAPVLGASENEDVVLTLPKEMKASDLKWVSIWCRKFAVNFGDLIFPENAIQFPDDGSADLPPPRIPPSTTTTTEAAPEPEPESEPEHHDDDEHDSYPEPEYEPEPESESEPEPEPHGGATGQHTASQLLMSAMTVCLVLTLY